MGWNLFGQAYVLGIIGVLAFFIGHILSDFTWFAAISTAFSRGKKLMNDTIYRRVILFLGAFIIIFSIKFVVGGWHMLFNR
ncbi:LysE family transporter [Petroclostridium xylanilyticum]|uniref:LysE family transporter n=1 Tax=Petroclostridium xylanilyticum TaxID=1792311 RepID=UPI001FA88BF7|nr:LysE family transporter [Petroclostridium xylanilyticum]